MPLWKQALRNLPIGLALALTVAPGGWLWVLVPAARALGPNALVAQTNPTVAEELLQLVNAERQRVGASPLVLNDQLTQAAQRHAQDMATSGRMGHTGSDGSTLGSRLDDTQYLWSTIGENVAMGHPTAAAVMAGWMSSPGHRQNILNPAFTELGIGSAVGAGHLYWTQVFARPR